MKIVLSPAKKLDYETPLGKTAEKLASRYHSSNDGVKNTLPFHDKTAELIAILRKLSAKQIAKQFNLSDKLADVNHRRFANFEITPSPQNESKNPHLRPAMFAFNGDVYEGLDPHTLDERALIFLAENAFILSGLYGLLRPFDHIQPYRLEMGKKLPNALPVVKYWGQGIADKLIASLEGQWLINAASQEYFGVLQPFLKHEKVLTVVFKDLPLAVQSKATRSNKKRAESEYKVISFHSKKARGLFARYLAECASNQRSADNWQPTEEQLCEFDTAGYRCFNVEETSSGKRTITFVRDRLGMPIAMPRKQTA